jgi:hypothetical protein
MTMHLCGPALSLNGRKKGRQKFRNAEQAKKSRELAAEWQELQRRWAVPEKQSRRAPVEPLTYQLTPPPGRASSAHIPSRDTGGVAAASAPKVYTGTMVRGIATLHKSNAVPVFSDQEAVEISRMRRG